MLAQHVHDLVDIGLKGADDADARDIEDIVLCIINSGL